jgi:hypothetical protein
LGLTATCVVKVREQPVTVFVIATVYKVVIVGLAIGLAIDVLLNPVAGVQL